MSTPQPTPLFSAPLWARRWQRFSRAALRVFHAYAGWLVSISWRRFIVLSLLLLMLMGILHDVPPLTWTVTDRIDHGLPRVVVMPPAPPVAPEPPRVIQEPKVPDVRVQTPGAKSGKGGVEISINKDGVSIRTKPPAAAEGAASAAGSLPGDKLVIDDSTAGEVRQALEEAKQEFEQAVQEARRDAEQALRDAEQARDDAKAALKEIGRPQHSTRVTRVGIGDFLMQLTVFFVLASAVIKITYKGRMQAEVKAAQATETAEAESLRRQVVEARMAAMQAQVEPHFLFNTLASIDHLIQTDPPRASQMQKNLIALLRASMPTMRETSNEGTSGPRELAREIAVIKPYLEILKVRMEERLETRIDVPEGLMSAEFPAMMIQTLVENAIKHGLEPKAEGGQLRVAAEIVHGKLQVTVSDTGLGFGKAPTAGTGVGLANIRERLQLLYGPKASLTVAANQPTGTVVSVTVPYKTVAGVAGVS